jgi:hypothetical protein
VVSSIPYKMMAARPILAEAVANESPQEHRNTAEQRKQRALVSRVRHSQPHGLSEVRRRPEVEGLPHDGDSEREQADQPERRAAREGSEKGAEADGSVDLALRAEQIRRIGGRFGESQPRRRFLQEQKIQQQ